MDVDVTIIQYIVWRVVPPAATDINISFWGRNQLDSCCSRPTNLTLNIFVFPNSGLHFAASWTLLSILCDTPVTCDQTLCILSDTQYWLLCILSDTQHYWLLCILLDTQQCTGDYSVSSVILNTGDYSVSSLILKTLLDVPLSWLIILPASRQDQSGAKIYLQDLTTEYVIQIRNILYSLLGRTLLSARCLLLSLTSRVLTNNYCLNQRIIPRPGGGGEGRDVSEYNCVGRVIPTQINQECRCW